ncbi:hypothetical protein [Methanocalculus sp.]|uniref:hypothetical protein n=1 Tax=Methanocalculus sp. TaxID=2004547 RepID=UPI00271BCE6B|nr:hypothetical protein [Methanocalculus sp.]MDO8842518.1 hypothetical protein [Methanocalculus sp.]
MFSKLRALFGRKEEPPLSETIPFDDLPAWLDQQEEEIRSGVVAAFTAPKAEIEIALDQLSLLIEEFEKEPTYGDDEMMAHPKVQSVLKTARPQSVRSLRQAMEKRPTGDPEAYYATAAEILKGVIAAAKGPGKYLHIAYKEEAPRLRHLIKDIGRAVNSMTTALTEAGQQREKLVKIRSLHRRLEEIDTSLKAAITKEKIARSSAESLLPKIKAAEGELASLPASSIKEEIREAEAAVNAALQQYAQVRAPAAAVLRRAEKLLKRHKAPTDTLKSFLEFCDNPIPQPDFAADAAPVIASIQALIASGELQLKNREEQLLFGEGTLTATVQAAIESYRQSEDRLRQIKSAAGSDPAIKAEERLTHELQNMKSDQARAEAAVSSAQEEQVRLLDEKRRLGDEITTALAEIGTIVCQLK